MNPKQFLNNGLCYLITKSNWISGTIKFFGLILYPDYPFLPKIDFFKSKNIFWEIVKLYFLVFTILFIIPVIWSLLTGRLWSDNDINTTNFFEDSENLWNYILICEFYVILGYFILKRNSNLRNNLVKSSFTELIDFSEFENKTKSSYGYIGILVLFIATFYFSAGYANDIATKSSSLYWFMESKIPHTVYSRLGYYYIFINFSLLFFVLIVALSYIGFINKIGFISSKIISQLKEFDTESLKKNWNDENLLKKKLSPISSQMLLLQLMVAVITLNVVLWNINKQGIGFNYNVTVFVLIIFGVWLFTLPRYYINYQIFRIWQKIGKHEYKNLSLPWIIGLSSVIDIILFSLLLSKLISPNWSGFLKDIFG